MRFKICATLCLLSAVFAASAAARTPAQLRTDVALAVHAYVQADSLSPGPKAARRARDAGVQPRRGETPAQLGAAGSAYAFRWVTTAGRRCYAIAVSGRGYSSPFGPCLTSTTPCAALCIASLGERDFANGTFAFSLGGTVPRAATTLDITLLDGSHVTAKPSASLVDGRRGVVVALGGSDLGSAVARSGSRVVGRMTRTAADIHHECTLLALHCTP